MQGQYKFEDVFTSSQEYANRFAGAVGAWLLSVQEEALLQALSSNVGEGTKMLDLGGAHGQLIEIASRLNIDLTIVASHGDAFKNLSQRISNSKLSDREYESITSDLFSVPAEDQSFPIVSSVRLISHCDDWRRLVAEMCRLSSDLVLIDYPPLVSSNIFYSLLFPIKKKLEGNTRTFTIFTHKEIEEAFQENGFKLKQRIGQFFWPMVIHRKLNSVAISEFLERFAAFFGLVRFFGNPTVAAFEREQPALNTGEIYEDDGLIQISKNSALTLAVNRKAFE